MSEETNFNLAAGFLKAALTELKKGEHDQLSSSGVDTIEERILSLIESCYNIKKRWESDD